MAYPTADMSQVGPVDMSQYTTLQMPQPNANGMFGGGKVQINPGNALAGYLAGRFPQYASSFLQPIVAREQMNREGQLAILRDNLEFNRQMQMAQLNARLALQYPTDEFSVLERAAGNAPGSPGYQKDAASTLNAKYTNPITNAGLYGPVVYSQVAGAANAPPAPNAAAIARLKANPQAERANFEAAFGPGSAAQYLGSGGPTQPASGGFLGSGGY